MRDKALCGGVGKGADSAELGDLSGVGVGDAEARGERGPEGFVVNLREREGEGRALVF